MSRTEAICPPQTGDNEAQTEEYALIDQEGENKNNIAQENYEVESFVNEEEEEEEEEEPHQDDHDDEYENDSFIIEDNGGTNDGDLTSPSPSFMSGEGDQSQEEVSN